MPEVEQERAEAFQRYVDQVVRPEGLTAGRKRLVSAVEDLYVNRLKIPEANERFDAIRTVLEDQDVSLIEIAHDGQIPHLGIIRLVSKAEQVARALRHSIVLYLVGDHYTAQMRPENLLLGLPLRGLDADHVKNPLTIPVGRRFRGVPFKRLPPPTEGALQSLELRAAAWIVNNAVYANRKRDTRQLKTRLTQQFEVMLESARITDSFGDWLMRMQVLWLDEIYGGANNRILVMPMSGLVDWVPEVLKEIADNEEKIGPVSAVQGEDGTRSGAEESGPSSSFWVYCPTCWRRYRARYEEQTFSATCASCSEQILARWPTDSIRVMPDIVAYEMALFRMGIAGWIVGSHAPYHPVIEQSYKSVYGIEMPPKFFITTAPRFWGIGEPPEGHCRARIIRVLLEVDPHQLRHALEVPAEIAPEIRSPFL